MDTSKNIIGDIHEGTPIYRIIKKKRFFGLFDDEQNTLCRPSEWDDPFENFILTSPVKRPDGSTGKFEFHNDVYGQCWTRKKASDALWRIYSPDNTAVRIKSRVGKLLAQLETARDAHAQSECFIGRVSYPSQKRLKEFARTLFKNEIRNEFAIAKSLLAKRYAFVHEQEVRLIYISGNKTRTEENFFGYPIDPHKLIEQVMIDPRIEYDEYLKMDIPPYGYQLCSMYLPTNCIVGIRKPQTDTSALFPVH
ncbi:MAG: DUF2971 domain-containing protein [Hyphomicrobiales bacterium]|nr:DUF2971 domain-containing protein [Hyphomicrobiales bacterium]